MAQKNVTRHTDQVATISVPLSEAARLLGVSRRTVYRWAGNGRLLTTSVSGRMEVPLPEIQRQREIEAEKAKGHADLQVGLGLLRQRLARDMLFALANTVGKSEAFLKAVDESDAAKVSVDADAAYKALTLVDRSVADLGRAVDQVRHISSLMWTVEGLEEE